MDQHALAKGPCSAYGVILLSGSSWALSTAVSLSHDGLTGLCQEVSLWPKSVHLEPNPASSSAHFSNLALVNHPVDLDKRCRISNLAFVCRMAFFACSSLPGGSYFEFVGHLKL